MKFERASQCETERLNELRKYFILDTPEESIYDELTFLTSTICGTPVAAISIIDEDRQWFKSKLGTDLKATPREVAFCAHAIEQAEVFVIDDALMDERFAKNPLVTEGPRIRFYAGAPLIMNSGYPMGTLCVIDQKPRQFSPADIRNLRILSNQVIKLMEWQRSKIELQEKELAIRETQLKLIESEKMSALGTMAGRIAHEINNCLTVVNGYAQNLKQQCIRENFDPNQVQLITSKIQSTVMRIAKIVRGISLFSRSGRDDPYEVVSVASIISDTVEFCRARFKASEVSLEVKCPEQPILLECRSVEVSQVLLNLLNNAFDAANQNSEKKWVQIEVIDAQSILRFYVTDSGLGISKEIQKKIMTPFFTTKSAGKGSGLGLSISKEIIEKHHGKLYLDAFCPNTRFVVELPKTQMDSNTVATP